MNSFSRSPPPGGEAIVEDKVPMGVILVDTEGAIEAAAGDEVSTGTIAVGATEAVLVAVTRGVALTTVVEEAGLITFIGGIELISTIEKQGR